MFLCVQTMPFASFLRRGGGIEYDLVKIVGISPAFIQINGNDHNESGANK